ncbi:hypothetical protein [Algoriphagus sediminis]|uniref:SprT-like domain-containing protein n=1 Tax=Algoriphagus sediminis TaxID=3057113 RepID=A0ABT7YC89_9BACT|nr:hypothetical protein [Algoriphagus sediminis]MDN3204128.1 hypothetical protein [Algoriphagus sediminis]
MVLFLSSCIDEPDNPQIPGVETSQIAAVRDWFETNKTKLRLPERGSNFRTESQELILPFFEKEPDWDKFHHYYFPDGREVFETSLENATKYYPSEMSEIFVGENPADFMIQNIMFVRHETLDQFNVVIARYYPGDNESKANFDEISYNAIPVLWNGKLELFTYDERFFVGFQFEDGKIEFSYTRAVYEGDKKHSQEAMDVRCVTNYYPVGYQVCVGENCHKVIERYVSEENCFGSDGGSPSYVYSGSGSGSGVRDPATDGGGSTCSSCYDPPELPEPKLTISLDKSIKENARARCIVSKLALSSFVNEMAEFTDAEGATSNSILKLASLPSDINGQVENINGIHQISINSGILNRPDLLIARTILHEMVHAEIYRALKSNGITPLDDDFAYNFDSYVFLRTRGDSGPQHHAYMAEQLLGKMGAALMEIHKTQFPEDYQKFNQYMNYTKGIPLDFYKNLFWEGLEGTKAFDIMSQMPGTTMGKSPFENYKEDIGNAKNLMTKPCGN